MAISKQERRLKIKNRVRLVVKGTAERPRLSVFRSNTEIYVQLIDDIASKTLVAASSKDAGIKDIKVPKVEKSKLVGKLIAERAIEANINNIVFDRNGYLYHGRVKSLAEGAREGGLKF